MQGAAWGLASAALCLAALGHVGRFAPGLGRALFIFAPVLAGLVACVFGVGLALVRLGDATRAARSLAKIDPALSYDLLAAVELERALSHGAPFSTSLAEAYLQHMDLRVRGLDPKRFARGRSTQRALLASGALVLLAVLSVAAWPKQWLAGWTRSMTRATSAQGLAQKEPITGDVELTYQYPAYMGLAPRTVTGTNGEVVAPAGTAVTLKTQADRDVERAELVVNGGRQPMRVDGGRTLEGSFIVDKAGSYHVAFVRPSGEVLVEGPEVTIGVEADVAPTVKLTHPAPELEVQPGERVVLRYTASDDYGLTNLELVYRSPGQEPRRVRLPHDEGRRSKGQYSWELADLKLRPGQTVSYYVEATDNDTVQGPKRGASRTQSVKLYSAAEHRREALRRAEALWERMVTHLADRMEGPDREPPSEPARITAGQALDSSGLELASELSATASEIARDRDAPTELVAALVNIADGTRRSVATTSDARRFLLRFVRMRGDDSEGGRRLVAAATAEIAESEKNILYLESLIDRQKLFDLKEMAEQLQRDRKELSSLVQDYKNSRDEKLQEAILRDIQAMKERISELMMRMGELAKSIRDEHINQEALKEMMEERDLGSALDQVEQLVREGKADEALAKLQELGMQMEEMLQGIEEGEDSQADEYPELAQKFQEFMDDLQATSREQKELAEQTRELKEKSRAQVKERLAQRGKALKEELLRKAEDVSRDYKAFRPPQTGTRMDRPLEEVQGELENLKNALKVEDFDLAAESAARAERASAEVSGYGEQQRQLDEMFQNPMEARKASREASERLRANASKVQDIHKKLEELFPKPGSALSEAEKQKLDQMAQGQRKLEQKAQGLRRKMEEMSQMAPVFGADAERQMSEVSDRMGEAAERMEGKDPGRGYGEQRAALDRLGQLEEQMKQSRRGKGKKGGLPLPMMAGRREGMGRRDREKIEIPDEEAFQAPKEFRKDLLDAMKQGTPEKYKDQVKRYYEELVK